MSNYCRNHWQPDDSRKDCAKCKAGFTFTNRRHHCRNCGGLFCKNCSSRTSTVPRRQIMTPVRVCDACFSSLSPAAAEPAARSANTAQPQNSGAAAAASPARAEPAPQPVVVQPPAEAVPQVPLANIYGIIKEEAGKAYLDVAVAAVREVVFDESQCGEQQYEFDAAGAIAIALPTPSPQTALDVAAVLLGAPAKRDLITESDKERLAEGLRASFDLPFPSLIVPFTPVQA